MIAFLSGQQGSLERIYTFASYARLGKTIEIVLDASPWGIGGYLLEDKTLKSLFWEQIWSEDAKILKCEIGSSNSQQCFEAFAALAALRIWSKRWLGERIVLNIKSDSLSTLILTLNLKSDGYGCNLIAREIALDVAQMCYKPDTAQHVRGMANIGADTLSRLAEPQGKYELPSYFPG